VDSSSMVLVLAHLAQPHARHAKVQPQAASVVCRDSRLSAVFATHRAHSVSSETLRQPARVAHQPVKRVRQYPLSAPHVWLPHSCKTRSVSQHVHSVPSPRPPQGYVSHVMCCVPRAKVLQRHAHRVSVVRTCPEVRAEHPVLHPSMPT
jgi:hypothetical protein